MDVRGKKLLIQGAGRGHLGLMKAAKEMGVYTVVTGLPGKYPCTFLADKMCYADISNQDEVLVVAEKESIDGIVICCSDTGLRSVGYVCDKMHLCGLSEKSAAMSTDKLLMKQALIKGGVRTAKFKEVRNKSEIQATIAELSFPLIIKATDLQGSRGIYIVRDMASLEVAFEKVMCETRQPYCIIEEFIEGREFGAQSFIYKGKILFVLPHGDETVVCQTAVPVGHYMPLDIDNSTLEADIIVQAEKAIKAIGLDNCAINIDFIEKDGKAYIIELTGRVGANCLPELTGNYWGINYYKMIITMALGEDPTRIFDSRDFQPQTTLSRMIKSDVAGIVRSIAYSEDRGNMTVEMFVEKDSEVRRFANSNDAIGQVILLGKTMEDCQKRVEEFFYSFRLDLI